MNKSENLSKGDTKKKHPQVSKEKNRLSTMYKKWYIILASSILVVSTVMVINLIPFFRDMENRTLDYRFKLYSQSEDFTDNTVLVTIDDISLQFFVENGISWPWPRDYYAHIVDYFRSLGAKGVLFDVIFYEPDLDRFDVSADYTDSRFAEAMKNYNRSVLASLFLPDSTHITDNLHKFNSKVSNEIKDNIKEYKGIRTPINIFMQNTGSVGFVNVIPDNDGIVRRVPLFLRIEETVLPSLSIAALLQSEEQYDYSDFQADNKHWLFDGNRIPTDSKGNYLINWYGDDGPQGVFRYYSFRAVIQSASAKRQGITPPIPDEVFKDKYIVIGATAPGLRDLIPSPITQTHPGMELWATVLNNFLNKDFISITSVQFNLLYLVVISFLLMFFFVRNPFRVGNILLLLLIILVIIIPFFFWASYRAHITLISPLMTVILSFMYITTVSYVSEGKSKKEIKKAFSRYLHPQIIEQLVNNPDLVDLQGEECEATMLFSDIYNFTNFSENTDPKTLIGLLNKYFETLTATILDNEGMLDKFMGDGLMAVFGAPLSMPDHAYKACRAALNHKQQWSNYKASNGGEDYSVKFHKHTRIGINSGSVVAGNMGSVRRVDYTVIGDSVNLAARLESINKYYATDIIISEFTYEKVKDHFICRELDFMKVKGKSQATRIYELLDYTQPNQVNNYLWIDDFVEALNLYREAKWDRAIATFSKLKEAPISDIVSKIMLDRCLELKDNTPKNWDGIYKWEVK